MVSITNGYDPNPMRQPNKESSQGVFQMVYTGQIYPKKQDPDIALDAILPLVEKGILTR